jgi:hypothetical protein
MKTKNFIKKLSLNKKTIATLDDAVLKKVNGMIATWPIEYREPPETEGETCPVVCTDLTVCGCTVLTECVVFTELCSNYPLPGC